MVRNDERFVLEDIGSVGLLVPLDTRVVDLNGIVTLNATARYLWELLAEQQTVDDLAAQLTERFEIDLPQARTDVQVFVDSMSDLGLLM